MPYLVKYLVLLPFAVLSGVSSYTYQSNPKILTASKAGMCEYTRHYYVYAYCVDPGALSFPCRWTAGAKTPVRKALVNDI
ncbi:hypothetical protein BKA67DRAFT_588983 [Truncatella angustata]|uniref:Uncharacterized protein n=1 Tax=Truncatella angustata TaxID=152316 RepID=A0A9P8RJ83_9PEZI|nr:uncharacterized protein BKA67DRAFT_588983 [Truncatella angustata]KAH6638622.1 hypothetical protein BKA67DRAFT_588983 [Truncatella angustata]